MKKGLIISSIVLTLVIGLVSFTSVFARDSLQKRAGTSGSFRGVLQAVFAIGDELRTLAKDVNLSENQKQQIKIIVLTAKPQALEFHSQIEAKRKELRSVLLSNNPNQAQIDTLSQDIASINSQIVTFRIQTISQVTQVLSLEQKETVLKDLSKIDPLLDELKDEIQDLAINSPLMK